MYSHGRKSKRCVTKFRFLVAMFREKSIGQSSLQAYLKTISRKKTISNRSGTIHVYCNQFRICISFKRLINYSPKKNFFHPLCSMSSRQSPSTYTDWPVNHGRVFLITCPVYFSIHLYTGQVTFYKVPEITAMFNWSLCSLFFGSSHLFLPLHIVECPTSYLNTN